MDRKHPEGLEQNWAGFLSQELFVQQNFIKTFFLIVRECIGLGFLHKN